MKHPRLILWYASIVPLTIVYILIALPMALIEFVADHVVATREVLSTLMMRYEMWAKYNDKGSIYNCPWKYTLREVYIKSLKGY
jgi:hypothetical protein